MNRRERTLNHMAGTKRTNRSSLVHPYTYIDSFSVWDGVRPFHDTRDVAERGIISDPQPKNSGVQAISQASSEKISPGTYQPSSCRGVWGFGGFCTVTSIEALVCAFLLQCARGSKPPN